MKTRKASMLSSMLFHANRAVTWLLSNTSQQDELCFEVMSHYVLVDTKKSFSKDPSGVPCYTIEIDSQEHKREGGI
eukprot:666569-Amphidinium_carterae.1